MMIRAFVVMVWLCVTAAPGLAQERVSSVALVPSVTVNVSPEDALALTTELRHALENSLVVAVLAGEEVTRRLSDQRALDQCPTDQACVRYVGSRLAVDEILFLVIVQVGETIQIDPIWAEVASGRSLSRPSIHVTGNQTELPRAVFENAAPSLLPAAPLRVVVEAASPLSPLSPSSPPSVSSPPARTGASPALWIAGSVAAAALTGGTIAGLFALKTDRELSDQLREDGRTDEPKVERLRSRMVTADILFATAAVAGVTAGILYWRENSADQQSLTVGAGPGDLGIAVHGRF